MANILIVWELGGGLGHLTPMVPLVRHLTEQGHRVFAAVKDMSRIERIFAGLGVMYFQAPVKVSRSADAIEPPRSFAHILHNSGFSCSSELQAMAEGWRNLYQLTKPDLILFDHAPTALLAARTCDARRATIGTGFCCPPDTSPFPDFRPWMGDATETLIRDEQQVLDHANKVLEKWKQPPLESLSQLYKEVDHSFLTTLAELDHYPERGPAEYYSAWPTPGGREPEWPDQDGKRVFAYLKSFHGLPALLGVFQQSACPTLVYIDGLNSDLRARFETQTLRFASERLDLESVGKTCDIAVLNGGHNATAVMLLAGRPVMQIPFTLEQTYNGSFTAQLDAGLGAFPNEPQTFAPTFDAVLNSERFSAGAGRFAARYADFTPHQQIQRIFRKLEELTSLV